MNITAAKVNMMLFIGMIRRLGYRKEVKYFNWTYRGIETIRSKALLVSDSLNEYNFVECRLINIYINTNYKIILFIEYFFWK